MSSNIRNELFSIAKEIARELRKRSTKAESILWSRLKDQRLSKSKFHRQHPILYDLNGKESFFIADFYCRKQKLVIELDGEYHKYQLSKDQNRTEILSSLGLKVIRFSNEEVINSLNDVLISLMQELR